MFSFLFKIMSILTSVTAFASPSLSSCDSVAIFGCGVLGTSLCKQILSCPDFQSKSVTAITKTTTNHEKILSNFEDCDNFNVVTMDSIKGKEKFDSVVFCAPPSGFEDYPGAVKEVAESLWSGPENGRFIFTSSGGIYGPGDGDIVNETSPLPESSKASPRSMRLIQAEEVVKDKNGAVLRLAGLYTLERGAHNFWLEKSDGNIKGSKDGIINLLHYEDAAGSCLAALTTKNDIQGKTYLISDSNPTTRYGICESALKSKRYADKKMPSFGESDAGGKGKIYDGKYSNQQLGFVPKYESFDKFMEVNK